MLTSHDNTYTNLVYHVLEKGIKKPNRTGIDTVGVFGYQMKFNLSDGTIPLLTTKKVHTKSIIHELLWYLQGADNIQYLKDNGVTIWDEWADEDGNLGPVYGYQWRKWPLYAEGEVQHIDQIESVVEKLKTNPNDRRMIVSAWNVADLPFMKLPPCHYTFQLYAQPLSDIQRLQHFVNRYNSHDLFDVTAGSQLTVDGVLDSINFPTHQLSLLLNQRSCDVGLGVPFNIAQYSILLRMFAEVANMFPGEFIWNGGDVHIYENHITALTEQIHRGPKQSPTLRFARKINDIDDFKFDDFIIEGYDPHPTIKMDVAV